MGYCHLCGKPTQSHQLGDYDICHTCWTERSDDVEALKQEIKAQVEQPLRELEQNEPAGIRIIRMVQQYAMRFRDELKQAIRAYDGEVNENTFPVFMNWFTFERELDDEATPAKHFLDYYDLPDWIAEAIKRLQQPVRGFFEVVEKHGEDRYTVRHLMDDEAYELYGNLDLDVGAVVGNKIRGEKDREFLQTHLGDFEFLGFLPYDDALIEADLNGISPFDVDCESKARIESMIAKL